jgi:amidase
MTDLCDLGAREAVALLRAGEVRPAELIEAALARIDETDPALNAMPTLCAERAIERAAGVPDGAPLAGLPIAVKDLNDVAGVRTTYGSPIFTDFVPDRSDLMVERLEERGAVVLGKSNSPEFGAGANTFNEVFGETRNPWDVLRTCGGSSGGSAAALAAGQVWLATGSDLGGSLRTPAGFCGVVGIRPSPGRVARSPRELPFDTLSVEGPMGRTVGDAALMLDAMSGRDDRDPLSLEAPGRTFLSAAEAPALPARIAWSADLGITPVEADVRTVCAAAVERLAAAGARVDEAHPDMTPAPEAFHVLRAAGFVAGLGPLLDEHRDLLKPDIVWNIEAGLAMPPERLGAAERARGAVHAAMTAFLETYDVLVCPSACVAPFPVEMRWPRAVAGVAQESYIDWLRITSAITLTGCPVVALPCGLTEDGLPIGLQLVGRPRGEHALLAAAAAAEEILGVAGMVPVRPRRSG